MFHCIRARIAGLLAAVALIASPGQTLAQPADESAFTIYVRGTAVGNEQVTVQQSADGWTITSSGRLSQPIDLVVRQFKARYDAAWHPLELIVDATLRGVPSFLSTTISGTTASNEIAGAPGTERVRRTDTIDPAAILMPNPFIAPYEVLAARLRTAASGTTFSLYQPGQGLFTALVGAAAAEKIQTVDRVIDATRTTVTFQTTSQPPVDAEIWADEKGRLLRLRIPTQGLEVAREDMAAVSTRRLTMTRANDETVRIQANGFSLAGTISKPAAASGPLPAVILVAGSGPTDRDETVAGIPIFGHIAHALADAGFLVLRYDKRGVGQSGGRIESAALVDYAEDLRAAIRMIADRKDVDRRRIALVGHSEGGSLALLAASKEKRVAAVALVATVGTTGADLNMYQVEHALERSNRPEAERQNTLDLQRRIQQAVLSGKGWEAINVPDGVRRQADTPYFQSFLAFDPARIMKDVDQPILILQGTLDVQVPPENADKLEAMAKARKKNPGVDVVKIAGVNHLLVPAKTGEVDEVRASWRCDGEPGGDRRVDRMAEEDARGEMTSGIARKQTAVS
ncbi:MAG: alpha/beta fold hydrolase [Vicinamibacterales bacterium]